jgi:LysR family transcriptional regulator for metE and metH
VTQSALSHQLREIEEKLGTPLFLRSRRRMLLTEAGRRILKTAASVLGELTAVEKEVRLIARGGEGILRISTQCNTCYHWLPPLIRKFHARFPRVEVEINVDATPDPLGALWRGELDLALLYSAPDTRHLATYPLFEDELMAILHPEHPLAGRKYLAAEDFREENLIAYLTPTADSLLFQKVLIPAAVSPRKVTQVMLTEAIVEMIRAGFGIGVLSHWFSAPYVRERSVRAVRITRGGLKRRWFGAAIQRPDMPAYMEEFTRLLSRCALPVREKVKG